MDIDDPANANTPVGPIFFRSRIWNKYGADNVKRWNRDKIILYLPNLPKTFDSGWDQNPQFTEPLFQALRDALEGPDAVMNLAELGAHPSLTRVLGNTDAGKIFARIHTQQRSLSTSSTSYKTRLEKTEGQRALVDTQDPEEQGMWQGLQRICPDMDRSDWVWELLRTASRKYMDVRFRNLKANNRYYNDGTLRASQHLPREPSDTGTRTSIMNNFFIHGGDLRFDALIWSLDFGTARYKHWGNEKAYMDGLFEYYYGMKTEVGVWLCKSFASTRPPPPVHLERFSAVPRELRPINLTFTTSAEHGNTISNGVDWKNFIYTINA